MNDNELDALKRSQKMACDGWFYAIQRIDLLIISISGAGVYVILETLKYASEKKITNLWSIKVSGILFVCAIVINFISQYTGKRTNYHHIVYCDEKILAGDTPTETQQATINKADCRASIWNTLTNFFNVCSIVLMFIGLFGIMVYFLMMF